VWEAFKTRFRVDNIVEFYASTEGNLMLFNSTGLVGALGFIPRIADVVYPVKMLRVDPDNNEKPLRDAAGRCLLCPPHEVVFISSYSILFLDPSVNSLCGLM
jgi:fatty-acyl-CoA synthase